MTRLSSLAAPLTLALASATLPALGQGVGAPLAPAPVGQRPLPSSGVDLERFVAELGAEEKSLSQELVGLGPRLDIVRHRMLARSRAYYRDIRAGFLPAGAGFDALVDHAARVERVRRAIERDVLEEAQLLKRSGEIQSRLMKIRIEKAPLDVQRDAMLHARAALQEADERRAAFSRAFETSARPDRSVAIYGADLGPSDGDTRGGFRGLLGRLPFPIAGRAEIKKIHLASAGGPAIELTAAHGASVRVVAAGRVAFADRYDDYGLTVIVDHGDRYHTVYANLGGIDVHAGDTLTGGTRLGTVGGERGPTVHFELRHNALAVDAGPWLGI